MNQEKSLFSLGLGYPTHESGAEVNFLCEQGQGAHVLHEDASAAFRSQGHVPQSCGTLQPSKSPWSTCGPQGTVLKARSGSSVFTLPVAFLSEVGGKRSWAIWPRGRGHTIETWESGRKRAGSGHPRTEKCSEMPHCRCQPAGSDSYGGAVLLS